MIRSCFPVVTLYASMFLALASPATLNHPAFAQTGAEPKASAPACPEVLKTEAAKPLLEKVQSTFRSINSIQADFLQHSYLSSLDQSEESRGEVFFLKPGKMKWQYAMPEKQIFLLKDQTVWFYQPDLNQVLIDTFEQVLISDLPVAFLMGLGSLVDDFQIEKACRGAEGIEFTLLPTREKERPQGELRQFTLMVDSQKFLPHGAKVIDISGNITSISLSNLKTDPKDLSSSNFELSLPSGVDTIDRRQDRSRGEPESDERNR